MSEEIRTKRKIDRVELRLETTEKLVCLQKQIEEHCPEVIISRKDLANWIILQRKDLFSESELKIIRETFFDSVQYLKSLLKKAESARLEGRQIELGEIVIPTAKPKKPKTRGQKIADETNEAPAFENQTSEVKSVDQEV